MINEITNFSEEEKLIAVELIDEALKNENDFYNIYVYVKDQDILGYYCIGKRSLTDGVFDLYWIAVSCSVQGSGIGKELLKHAEDYVKSLNGRWVLAETSSKESYINTRNFYLRNYYTIVAEINDFYSVGDNQIIFGKYLI